MGILSRFFGNKKEEKEENTIDLKSGKFTITYDTDTGVFRVIADITDTSDDGLRTLSAFFINLHAGLIQPYFYEAMVGWAEKDKDKLDFCSRLAENIQRLSQESFEGLVDDDDDNDQAVSAEDVFKQGHNK